MDINQLTKQGQEVSQGVRGQKRRYMGQERRDFNIRMRVTIEYLQDEDLRMQKLKEWYSVLYRANNSIVVYQYETSADGKQLENPDRFPQTYQGCEEYFGDMREYNGKFCWVVRVSEIGAFKDLRDDLYP